MTAPQASSRLEMLQARFQQKQLQEKEQKLLQLYDQQQQRAYQVVQRGSAGSSSSNHGSTVRTAATTTATAATHTTSTSQGGKVRQMFDERRQTTVKGIDRSYPLEPLENKLRKQTNTNGVVTQRNGNVTVNRQSVKRVSRADVNSNVNGGKPVVSYHEEIIRESFGPPVRRHDDDDEYGVENRVATFANGYYRHEADNEQEEVLDQDTMERNRMMAKIHLMGYDETLKHRVRNDLESEEFPEYLMVDVPDKLSKRNVTKKLSQAEERLERFKNANAKRSNMSKQSNSTSTVIRKRSKQMVPTKSNSRPWSEIARTSPSSARSGSSRTSERSQRILACAKSPLPSGTSRIVDDVNARRTESSDTETFIRRASPRSFSMRETAEVASSPKIRRNEFKSLTSDGKIFMRRSASPRFFCKESERSGTTIDRKSDSSGSPLFYRETLTKRNKSPPVFLSESEQSRRTSESKSPIWYDKRISSRESTSPPYLRRESKRSETALSTDREIIGSKSSEWSTGTLSTKIGRLSSASKSPSYKEEILKRRSISPQFFCRESERGGTTMSIDRATSESRSSSHNREIVTKRSASPFFLTESKQFRRTSESKSPIWDDKRISSRQSTSSPYLRRESKRSETALSTDRETIGSKSSEWSTGTLTSTNIGRSSSASKSPSYKEEILKRRSTSPQFFCRESERGGTTMSIDHATSESKLSSQDWEIITKRSTSPQFFLSESKQSHRTSESTPPIWDDKRVSSRQNTSSPYLRSESKQSEEILKGRSTSPQFFCRESERGGTTMSIDRATNITSPSYLYGESNKQSERALSTDRKTIGSKLSEWNKEITKRDMTDVERKKIETNRQFFSSKSPSYKEEILTRQSSSPQFSCRKSERSGTNMNIDRKHRLSLREQKVLIDRLLSGKAKQQSAFITNIDRKYNGFKLSGIVRDRRTTSPQFFCKESEKSATTMLIESKSKITDSKDILKERDYISNTSYRQSVKSPSSIDKKIGSTQSRYSPLVTRYEQEKASKKNEINAVTNTRRSSKISEASASSIVNLRYGLEFDNIFQSAGLVRKFMKSQDGEQRETRQSPSRKRNIKDVNARISARGNQSRNRRKTPSPFQTAKSPSLENRKRTTPELFRKSITPTEVDMEIQEIIMTDHRIERDKLQKTPSPISKRQIDGTYTKSNSRVKSKTSITCPVRKTHRQRESILESSVFKSERSLSERGRKSIDHRSDQEIEGSAISLSKLSCSPVSQSSQRIITRDRKENETKVSRTREQTRKQSARNESRYVATRSTKHEKRQRANSRSPNQMGGRRPAGNRIGSPRVTSPDFSRTRKYRDDTVSPILHLTERTKGTRTTKVDQLQSLQSARLVRGAIKDRTLSADDECNRERGDENKNVAIDAGIGVKYHTVVKTALNSGIKDRRKIARPNAVDRIASGKISPRETTQKPMKSSTSKKTFSPTRECGRRHDVKSRISPRVSPLRKTTEISRSAGSPRIFSSRGVVSKADQTSTFSKFSTYSVKDRKRDSVPTAKKLMESFDKISAKRKIEEPREAVREFSKVRHEDKYERDFERTDSVESALKRFDSIGAEFERSCPSLRTSPDISLQTMNVQTKESIASKETTIPSSETTNRTISGSTLKSTVGKDLKEVENTARKSDLKMIQKETRSSGRPTRTETNFVENKQSLTKIRSPKCKRRLFESDSEKEERQKSSCSKARKNDSFSSVSFRFRKDETLSNVRSKSLDRDIARESKTLEETFSVKPLRSIEDIRKSIDNERNKLVAIEESRSAIANRRSASREDPNAARKIFLEADSARLTKVKSCVSRITKSPSPDSAATKQRETNVRTTRGSTPSSPSKSPDVAPRRTESRNQETKSSRKSTGKSTDSIGNKATTAVDTTDGTVLQNSSLYESTTRKSNAFMIDYDDRPSREDDAIPSKKSPMKKSSDVRSNDKQQAASSASGRPTSSNSGVNLIQDSSTKSKMAERERGKGMAKEGGVARGRGMEKSSSSGSKLANASSFNEDATNDTKGLIKCKTCGRSFAQNRIDLHENICSKTTTKKRKQFDPVMSRVKGTELEPFVKKSLSKRETKTKKPEAKSDWRRKHEEFINAIRYARETQARLAAGENLSDLPPPPASDTSDYIQCEHCGRKFNRSAAERHVPICKRMHDKKQTQASRMKH